MGNIVNREFDNRDDLEIVVSDLTYVNVDGKWHYIYKEIPKQEGLSL